MSGILITGLPFLSELLDALPSYIFVFDRELRLAYYNKAAAEFMEQDLKDNLETLCGEALHCINSGAEGLVCGKTRFCRDCVLRSSISKAFDGEKVFRVKTGLSVAKNKGIHRVELRLSTFPFHHDGSPYVLAMMDDISELNALRAIVPICAWCKKIRDDEQYWHRVDDYLATHMDLQLTHGICPECRAKIAAELTSD